MCSAGVDAAYRSNDHCKGLLFQFVDERNWKEKGKLGLEDTSSGRSRRSHNALL